MITLNTRQFLKFCLAGGGGLIINLFITHFGVTVLGVWYFWSYLVATLVGWSFIYTVNALITFPDPVRSQHARRYALFLGGYLVFFAVHAALVYTGTSVLNFHYFVSIIAATVVTTILTFFYSKYVVYR